MKKKVGYIVVSVLMLVAGACNLVASVFLETAPSRYGFLVAAVCFFISAAGFLGTYLKSRKEK